MILHHHHSFLGPRVVPNRNTDRWTSNFKTSSNLIALKLMVNISFLDHWLSNCHSNIVCAHFNQCLIVYVFLEHTSLYHLIWQMLSPCSHNCGNPSFENLNELSLSQSATSSYLLDLMMNSYLRTHFHSSSPENLRCGIDNLCCTFLLRHPESELPWHQSDLNLGQIWWLEHISKSYNIGLFMTR